MAELLGYGKKRDYQPMYAQLDSIEKASAGAKTERLVRQGQEGACRGLLSFCSGRIPRCRSPGIHPAGWPRD
jgi:hypothetical protein